MDRSLSTRSQGVMNRARDEAARLQHEYIGTEHILLGIANESSGIIAETLKSFGITLEQIRAGVEGIIGIGPPATSPDARGVTPRAKQVLKFAQEEAALRGSEEVDPEHLLLGLTRELQGVAVQVLCELQAHPESVRKTVWGLMSRGDTSEPHSG